jgi:ribosome assembly protein 1
MKASSIGLIFGYKAPQTKADEVIEEQHHLVNLIDSPGHVDFSVEVNSAVTLSDGALVLIDCVEGVSPQTQTVIRQAWHAKVKTCLVLNKLDRLMAEKYEDPSQIYILLQQIIENANTIIAELIQGDFLKNESHTDDDVEKAE